MSAESMATGQNEHLLRAFRRRFRDWRGQRPFWAGLFTMLGGLPIAYFPYADVRLGNLTIAMSTTAGAGSLIIGVLLVTLGMTMWFHAIVRVFAGVAAIVLALVSLPVANIGGFVFGFLFSLIGGALSVSWAPGAPLPPAEETPGDRAPEPAAAPQDSTEPGEWGAPVPATPNTPETTTETNGGRNSAG
ncbi:DUF6114 domain-containing protein [Streptomyces albipurpureus]|uniref:DUF6114 domain-containing protein n=1 Tax=Streptomyces albipurpureus TaxID=2897419 RepID=A0ABT0UHQ5_9ACTN|nr:DUF6114 domain-containing protein [Streptomyces sp. CWNU-1]MCM2387841.1 DUF6114 domain-containing protein [Streptomyces sp. CWNU-1]